VDLRQNGPLHHPVEGRVGSASEMFERMWCREVGVLRDDPSWPRTERDSSPRGRAVVQDAPGGRRVQPEQQLRQRSTCRLGPSPRWRRAGPADLDETSRTDERRQGRVPERDLLQRDATAQPSGPRRSSAALLRRGVEDLLRALDVGSRGAGAAEPSRPGSTAGSEPRASALTASIVRGVSRPSSTRSPP